MNWIYNTKGTEKASPISSFFNWLSLTLEMFECYLSLKRENGWRRSHALRTRITCDIDIVFIGGWLMTISLAFKHLFQFDQLSHKIEIWRNNWTLTFDQFIRVHECHQWVTHQICYCYSCGSRYSCLTVN